MFRWLSGLTDDSYESEQVAGLYHAAHAVFYGLLIGSYIAMTAFHLAAAKRHFAAAKDDLRKENPDASPPRFV